MGMIDGSNAHYSLLESWIAQGLEDIFLRYRTWRTLMQSPCPTEVLSLSPNRCDDDEITSEGIMTGVRLTGKVRE